MVFYYAYLFLALGLMGSACSMTPSSQTEITSTLSAGNAYSPSMSPNFDKDNFFSQLSATDLPLVMLDVTPPKPGSANQQVFVFDPSKITSVQMAEKITCGISMSISNSDNFDVSSDIFFISQLPENLPSNLKTSFFSSPITGEKKSNSFYSAELTKNVSYLLEILPDEKSAYAPVYRKLMSDKNREETVSLGARDIVLSGQLYSDSFNVAGAEENLEITLFQEDFRVSNTALSDAKGVFSIVVTKDYPYALSEHPLQIRITPKGVARKWLPALKIPVSALSSLQEQLRNLRLNNLPVLVNTQWKVEAEDQSPVKNAQIFVKTVQPLFTYEQTLNTNETGRANAPLWSGGYYIVAHAAAQPALNAFMVGDDKNTKLIDQNNMSFKITLGSKRKVRLFIENSQGQPAANAKVKVLPVFGNDQPEFLNWLSKLPLGRIGTTNSVGQDCTETSCEVYLANGSYQIGVTPASGDLLPSYQTNWTLNSPSGEFYITLPQEKLLRVRVTDDKSQPIPFSLVQAYVPYPVNAPKELLFLGEATTDDEGYFQIVAPSAHDLSV